MERSHAGPLAAPFRAASTEDSAALPLALLALGIASVAADLGSVLVKAPFLRRGVTAGDVIEAVGVFVVLALFAWASRIALPARGRAISLTAIAAATFALGHGMHLAANSIHDALQRGGIGDPAGLVEFWDEHASHYLIDSARILFAAALTSGAVRAGEAGAGGAAVPGRGGQAAVIAGGLAYGWILFASAVEGQTVPLVLPFTILYAAWSLRARRSLSTGLGGPRRLIVLFFAAAAWMALLFFAVWGIWQRGFPEFTRAGLLKSAVSSLLGVRDAEAAQSGGTLPESTRPRLTFKPHTIQVLDGTTRPAEIGRLAVPELHAQPGGRSIAIAFLRLRTPSTTPGPPVVFLPGGPGYPGTLLARAPAYIRLFEKLREQSDVYVLDQRGAGLSEPTLQCAARGSIPPDAFESEPKTVGALAGLVRPCVRLVRSDGITVEAYNTVESAEDLEDLRRAIGAERLRLVAASYGTELALEMIRRHGDRVDAAVLAGTRGPDMTWRLPSTADIHLRRFGALVAADPRWGGDLPEFEGTVRQMIERLSARPTAVWITDVKTRRKSQVRVGAVGLQAILSTDLSDWTRAPLLPAMFGSLLRGDSTLFARRVEDLVNTTAAGISVMQIATDCASGASPERRSRVAREARSALLGNVKNMLVNPAFCDLVGSGDLGPAFREPITANTRALFVTGAMDGVTPPFQAEEVRWGFPNGVHLVVENGWHETLPFPDVQQAVADFFGGKDVRGRRIVLPAPGFMSVEEAKRFTAPRDAASR
jgi:pimeloyl-ACP methyl ester carboxylesterase